MYAKRMMAAAAIAASTLLLAGCPTNPVKVPENGESITTTTKKDGSVVTQTVRSGYAVQTNSIIAMQSGQKPIFELEGIDGQPIELKGVKRLAVYAPQGAGGGNAAIAAPQREPSGWEKALMVGDALIGRGLRVLGLVYTKQMGIAQINAQRDTQLGEQRMVVDLAGTVGGGNAQIASFIQAPAGTTTTNNWSLTNDNGSFLTLGNNSPLTSRSNNTHRQCQGGNGAAAGGGSNSTTGAGAAGGAGGPGGSANC